VTGELEGQVRQLTMEAESSGHVMRQLELSNAQLQTKIDKLHTQLHNSEARFFNMTDFLIAAMNVLSTTIVCTLYIQCRSIRNFFLKKHLFEV